MLCLKWRTFDLSICISKVSSVQWFDSLHCVNFLFLNGFCCRYFYGCHIFVKLSIDCCIFNPLQSYLVLFFCVHVCVVRCIYHNIPSVSRSEWKLSRFWDFVVIAITSDNKYICIKNAHNTIFPRNTFVIFIINIIAIYYKFFYSLDFLSILNFFSQLNISMKMKMMPLHLLYFFRNCNSTE